MLLNQMMVSSHYNGSEIRALLCLFHHSPDHGLSPDHAQGLAREPGGGISCRDHTKSFHPGSEQSV
jgi:hypothetical protein